MIVAQTERFELRVQGTPDFKSGAIPGYATSAVVTRSSIF